MGKSYEQVLKQIDKLKAEAEKLRKQEISGVIDRIRDAVRFYGLTASDLGLTARRGRPPKAASAGARPGRKPRKSRSSAAIKFRNEAGQTWVGRGKRPQWLRDALAAGKKLEDFAVK